MKPSTLTPAPAVAAVSGFLALLGAAVLAGCGADPAPLARDAEWPSYGGDPGSRKYSEADQIHPGNVARLEVVWRWESPDNSIVARRPEARPFIFEATPLMIDGALYTSTSLSQVAAIDASTGRTLWLYDPQSYLNPPPGNVGFTHRGVAHWRDGQEERIFVATGDAYLISLDAKTGKPDPAFGQGGRIDLTQGLSRPAKRREYGVTSPPTVCRDVVVVGSSIADWAIRKDAPRGDVRGFDARTGQRLWTFHSVPQEGELGNETWEGDSAKSTGHLNVWAPMSADEELGYVYLPFGAPTNDYFGGHRPGDNLFAASLVCLDARTGKRIWHFQIVHHGLWDYDLPAPPILADLLVDGAPTPAVLQITKQAFVFAFDRRNGEPVWPIEERPVPPSNVPGERSSPTQPFPAKPPPFDRQGLTFEDLIDFTPELRREAGRIIGAFHHGPLYTPPAPGGTVNMPGNSGGGYWAGGSFDPGTGLLFVPSISQPYIVTIRENEPGADFAFSQDPSAKLGVEGPQGLPIVKPPYSRITAIDMNTGSHRWMVPLGEGPRDHPLLKDFDLPPLGSGGRGLTLATRALLFAAESQSIPRLIGGILRRPVVDCCNNRPRLMAMEKSSGRILWETSLPAFPAGSPMTYVAAGRQYVVTAIGGLDAPAELLAFSLPR